MDRRRAATTPLFNRPDASSPVSSVEYVFRYLLKEQDDGRWSAECPDIPECTTYGDDQDHALERLKEAVLGVIEIHERDGTPVPAFVTGTPRTSKRHAHHPAAFVKAGSQGKRLEGLLTA